MEGLSRRLSGKDVSQELATVDQSWKEQLIAGDALSQSRRARPVVAAKRKAAGTGSSLHATASSPVPASVDSGPQDLPQHPIISELHPVELELQQENPVVKLAAQDVAIVFI